MIDMKRIAELSRIEFTEEELGSIAEDMKQIIGLMDKVCEFDGGETLIREPVKYGELKADVPQKYYDTQDILKNAKKTQGSCFVVPKVV